MKTRIICILLALALAAVGLSACGKTQAPADTTAVIGGEEDGQNPVMNFIGNYQSDRRTMLVEAKGMDEAKVTVHWGSDAWTYAEWTMTGKIVEEGDGLVMRYTDGAYATVTTAEDGSETRTDETTGGTGTVWFNADYTITWTDDQDEEIRELRFEWLPVDSGTGVNIVEKLTALMVSDKTLGIAGKYSTLADIRDGSVDPDVIGTWTTADGDMTYTYGEDGVVKITSEVYGDSQAPFTCLTIDGYKILCEEVELSPEYYDGAEEGDTQLAYTAYSVENGAMYQVVVEEVNEDYTSSMSALVMMYRADETGSAAAAIADNPINLQALNGTWTSDQGSFTISGGTLTLGGDSFQLSLDEKNDLVVEKDGASTTYNMAVSVMKEYDYEDRTQFTTSTVMGISFTGADENDKPNLLPVLDDYKAAYEYDSWYYSGSFKLQ